MFSTDHASKLAIYSIQIKMAMKELRYKWKEKVVEEEEEEEEEGL